MINSILVIADPAEGDVTALAKAREAARLFKAEVRVLRVVSQQAITAERQTLDWAGDTLAEELVEVFGAGKIPPAEVIASDDIAGTVLELCQREPFDLVIKTGHRSEKLFYTPTDWQLIRRLPAHVLIGSAKRWRPKPVVLATVDIEPRTVQQQALNQRVLALAGAVAGVTRTRLAVAYSLPLPRVALELDLVERDAYVRRKRPEMNRLLQEILAQAGLHDVDIHFCAGPAEKTLPSLANKLKAAIVVVGSTGRSGIKGALLGNTAEKILHNLRTDILVVKPG